MVQAAKAMAGLGVKALTEPDLIAAAKADLQEAHHPHALCQPAAGQRRAAAGHVAGLT